MAFADPISLTVRGCRMLQAGLRCGRSVSRRSAPTR